MFHADLPMLSRVTAKNVGDFLRHSVELLFVKFWSLSVSCLSQANITYAIDSICTS